MRVLVTGGTGFVGSHTVAALRSAGHEVRLLVRKPERIGAALEPLGIAEPIDYVVGDVTNRESVNRALADCDAAVHAAAVYNLDARAAKMTKATNVPGTRVVLGRWCADHDRPAGWRRGTPRPTPERPDAAAS